MPVEPGPARDPARWGTFVALVTEAGVDEETLLRAFPQPDDVEDILLTPDAALEACARTVIEALARRAADASVAERERGNVRCADCARFVRSATHPRLGRCGAGEPASAAGGWWDTQPRRCGSFVVQST